MVPGTAVPFFVSLYVGIIFVVWVDCFVSLTSVNVIVTRIRTRSWWMGGSMLLSLVGVHGDPRERVGRRGKGVKIKIPRRSRNNHRHHGTDVGAENKKAGRAQLRG